MTTSLITGVTGQDGGYLAELLARHGHVVHGLVKKGESAEVIRGRLPNLILHEGDLREETLPDQLLRDVHPDWVFHLAGVSSVAFSWEQPVLTAEVTALATARLLEAAHAMQGDQPRVLLASSAEIFGVPDQVPQDELTPVRPVSPYGAAKAYGHQLAGVYRRRGMHVSSLVLYNHESPRRPETFVTRKITKAVAAISIGQAEELVLGNLDVSRDWGWAPDFVDAMVRALEEPEPDDYVIATGVAHSVRDFVGAAFSTVGIEDWSRLVRLDARFARPVDAPVLVGDAAKARARLGWSPTTSFRSIVAQMVENDLRQLGA